MWPVTTVLGRADIKHFPHYRKFYWTDLIQDLKLFPVWGKPLKIYYGNPYLSLLSAQVTSYTVAQMPEICLPPQLSTKTDDRTNQKCLGWSNLKYQITSTRGKQI